MELLIEREGGFQQRTLPDGEHLWGDAEGVPGRLGLTLFVEGGRLSIEASAPVRVGGVLLPPRLRRLVVPGEPLEPVRGYVLRVRPEPPSSAPATRALVRGLLEQAEAPLSAGLVCLTGMDAGRTLPLGARPVRIGRGEGADLRLRDRAVSRLHARLSPEGDTHAIEDLGAPNGVHVNGARVIGRQALDEGALVELGQTLLRYSSGRAVAVAAPPLEAPDAPATPEAPAETPPSPSETALPPDGSALPSEASAHPPEASAPSETPDLPPGAANPVEDPAPGGEPLAEEGADPSDANPVGGRWLLLASGLGILLVGIGLTFGCLR